MKRSVSKSVLPGGAVLLLWSIGAVGQTAAPAPAPRPTIAPVVAQSPTTAPQVVTIVHRLNGIKLLRLLRRASGDKNTVATVNNSFTIDNEVHTNILAGLAMGDGRTIVAWLPQAQAEIEASLGIPQGLMAPMPPGTPVANPELPPMAPVPPNASHLTVLARDGRELRARYIGLDGQTGISVLRIGGVGFAIPNIEIEKAFPNSEIHNAVMGQRLRLFAPEGAARTSAMAAGKVYVRVGESEVRVARVPALDSGISGRLIAQATNLSPAVVGGIAIDDAGHTVGIVESVTGAQASIIPLEAIRLATKRVIERQSSVPRPLLGVRGEAIGFVPRDQLLLKGWPLAEAMALLGKKQGIMLTSVAPGTPAAKARLRPGDVILSINEKDIKSAQDFSTLMAQCVVEVPVRFTIARPDQATPEAITVKLADVMNFNFRMELEAPHFKAFQAAAAGRASKALAPDLLTGLGIETIAFDPRAAARLRAQSGLVVVALDREGVAYRAGVREGDVIETIDNHITSHRAGVETSSQTSQTIVLGIVRNGQRSRITIQRQPEKKD